MTGRHPDGSRILQRRLRVMSAPFLPLLNMDSFIFWLHISDIFCFHHFWLFLSFFGILDFIVFLFIWLHYFFNFVFLLTPLWHLTSLLEFIPSVFRHPLSAFRYRPSVSNIVRPSLLPTSSICFRHFFLPCPLHSCNLLSAAIQSHFPILRLFRYSNISTFLDISDPPLIDIKLTPSFPTIYPIWPCNSVICHPATSRVRS